ncbi:MAG: tetratricopeptide repeat protein, partial [Verrucomicrobiota bacterium]
RFPTRESRFRSNLHQGAVGVGIDLTSGVTTHGIHHEREIEKHPDTGHTLAGIEIPGWKKEILPVARRVAERFPLRFHGVDIMLDEHDGPQVLEVNGRPGLAIQLANRTGLRRLLSGLSGLLLGIGLLIQPMQAPAQDDLDAAARRTNTVQNLSHEKIADLPEARARAAEDPDDATLQNDLAVALYQNGEADEAMKALTRALELDPTYARAHYNLGTFYLLNGELARAKTSLERAVQLNLLYTEALYNLGLTLMRQDNFAEAANRFRAITEISKSPRHYRAWYNLGLCLSETENLREAARAYEQARNLRPDHIPSYINHGAVLSRLGLVEAARKSYNKALSLNPESWKARYNLALAIFDAGVPEDALRELEMLTGEDASRPEVLGLTGNLLLHLERPADAVGAFAAAYRKSERVEHLYNLGKAWGHLTALYL